MWSLRRVCTAWVACWMAVGASASPLQGHVDRGGGFVVELDSRMLRAQAAAGRFTVRDVAIAEDLTVDLELERFTVTGPETRFVRDHDEEPVSFDPDRVLLLRGTVVGAPRSHVYLATSPWGTLGRVDLGSGDPIVLGAGAATGRVPLAVSRGVAGGAAPPEVPLCGSEAIGAPQNALPAPVLRPRQRRVLELAAETDHELYRLFGDTDATLAYTLTLWGAVSDIFLREVDTGIRLSFVRVWDQEDGLYNGPEPLYDFLSHWWWSMGHVHRDSAMLVSGRRDFPYGGAAYLESLCTYNGYGVTGYIMGSFVAAPSVFSYDVMVIAHELGHNFAAYHTHDYGLDTCNDLLGPAQRGSIMSYCGQTRSGGNANHDLRFHSRPRLDMLDHLDAATCVAVDCNGNGLPDDVDIRRGGAPDMNRNGVPDTCEDCDGNGVLDPMDLWNGVTDDANANGVPDTCEPDCNGNGQPDDLDILLGLDTDLHGDRVPDGCEVDCDGDGISDYSQIMQDMRLDVDRDARLDACQDCDGDGVQDLWALDGVHNVWVASSASTRLAEFHARSGVRLRSGDAGQLADPQDLIATPDRRILVSSGADDRVVAFDDWGRYLGDLVPAGAGGLDFPTGLALSPHSGHLLVASRNTGSVVAFDAQTGAFEGEFVADATAGLDRPWGLAFGPAGDLYVTSDDGRVLRYDGLTGAPGGAFVRPGDNGGLVDPHGLLFRPDGDLLVASTGTDEVLLFDGGSGDFVRVFNLGGTPDVLTLDAPWSLRLGPDGDLYVSRHEVEVAPGQGGGLFEHDIHELHINSTRIYIFDVGSGVFMRSHVTGHDTGLSHPTAFDFMPGDTDCDHDLIPDSCQPGVFEECPLY